MKSLRLLLVRKLLKKLLTNPLDYAIITLQLEEALYEKENK